MNLSDTAFLLKSNLTLSLTRPGAFMHPPTTSSTALYLQHPFHGLSFKKAKKWIWNKGHFLAVSLFLVKGGLIEPMSASLPVFITLQSPQTVWNQWQTKNHPMLIFSVKIYWQCLSLIQSAEVKNQALAICCKVKHLIHHPWITMMYSSYRAVHAQEEDQTYLIEDNHQSATIPVHHRQQTNKQKQKRKRRKPKLSDRRQSPISDHPCPSQTTNK